jgi:hypothetical protein
MLVLQRYLLQSTVKHPGNMEAALAHDPAAKAQALRRVMIPADHKNQPV